MSTVAYYEQRTYSDSSRLTATPFNGLDFQAHWQHDYELVFITGGRQNMGVNQQLLSLQAGHIVLIRPNDIHYFIDHRQVSGFMFIFQDEWLNDRLSGPSRHWIIQDVDKISELSRLSHSIIDEAAKQLPFYEIATEGYLQQFLAMLFRATATVEYQIIDNERPRRAAYMQEILSYIDEQYCSLLTRETLASQFHISASHLSRLFLAATGQTISEYLARKRINSVCSELRQTDVPVTEIALRHGFASIRTFNRVFKHIMEKAPTAVRSARDQVDPVPES